MIAQSCSGRFSGRKVTTLGPVKSPGTCIAKAGGTRFALGFITGNCSPIPKLDGESTGSKISLLGLAIDSDESGVSDTSSFPS